MFHLKQVSLLSVLLVICHVLTEDLTVERKNINVSRGDSIMFTCNTSGNIALITWTKGRFYFSHSMILNRTFSNFTSDTVRIDPEFPFKLNILNAQHDDAGLYTCFVFDNRGLHTTVWNLTVLTDDGGVKSTVWNLTVSEKPEEILPLFQSWYFKYILTPISGLFLCGIILAVCYYRTPKKKPYDNMTLTHVQFRVQRVGEVLLLNPPHPQTCAEYRQVRNRNRGSRHFETLSSMSDLSSAHMYEAQSKDE